MELTKCKLGELITQRREKNYGSDLPICGVSKDGLIPPKQKDADTSIYNVFYRDDFIFNPARMELNSIAINDMYDRAICSSLYEVFYVHRTDLLLPHYLKLIIRQKWFTRYCEFLGQGSAREYCRFGNISEIEIEFPPIKEQQKIVDYNTAIENRIALKQKINDNLDATMQAIYKSYFIDLEPFQTESMQKTKLGNIPLTWKVCKFNEICELLNGRAYSQEELLNSGKYRVLRVGNFFTQSNWYYSNMELEDNKYCYPDDLLFCWSASFGLYIWNDIKTIYHYHIWKIDFSKSSQLYREYIYLYLRQEVQKLSKEGHGSVMAHLTKNGVENLDIISPSSEVVEDFHNKILPFIEHKKILEKEIQRLDALRETYLSQLAN